MNASGLRTDFYELTMMNGYLDHGLADRRAVVIGGAVSDEVQRQIPRRSLQYCVTHR